MMLSDDVCCVLYIIWCDVITPLMIWIYVCWSDDMWYHVMMMIYDVGIFSDGVSIVYILCVKVMILLCDIIVFISICVYYVLIMCLL